MPKISHMLSRSISSHFGAIHSLRCASQPKITKKFTKTPILGVQCHSKSSMLTPLRRSSLVFVLISRMSVLICNCFHIKRANISKNNYFLEGYPSLTLACTSLLEPKGSALGLLKSEFNAENFICRLSWSIFKHLLAIHS